MVLACSWAGKEVEECCNFAVHVMTDLGKCIRFSSFGDTETMQYQKISGAYYGFHILLDILLDERNSTFYCFFQLFHFPPSSNASDIALIPILCPKPKPKPYVVFAKIVGILSNSSKTHSHL